MTTIPLYMNTMKANMLRYLKAYAWILDGPEDS